MDRDEIVLYEKVLYEQIQDEIVLYEKVQYEIVLFELAPNGIDLVDTDLDRGDGNGRL